MQFLLKFIQQLMIGLLSEVTTQYLLQIPTCLITNTYLITNTCLITLILRLLFEIIRTI